MQLSYHAYYFFDNESAERYRADLNPFLAGYVRWRNAAFKNDFLHNGESVFLLPAVGNIYLFVQTRDNDIIHEMRRDSMTVTQIQDALSEDGSVGFSSFILIEPDHLAIGSTVLAPRIAAFGGYMNTLLARLETGLSFATVAMTHTLPKADAQRLTHVGNFSMKVRSGNRLWNSVIASLGGNEREDFDVGSIEVTIKPAKPRGNTERALKAAINTIGEAGLEAFDAKAKVDMADRVTDVFIVGAGGIRDPIDSTDQRTIPDQISAAAAANQKLKERLDEFRQDGSITHVGNAADMGLSWPPARAVALGTDPDI